jgi:hypothetical protein
LFVVGEEGEGVGVQRGQGALLSNHDQQG